DEGREIDQIDRDHRLQINAMSVAGLDRMIDGLAGPVRAEQRGRQRPRALDPDAAMARRPQWLVEERPARRGGAEDTRRIGQLGRDATQRVPGPRLLLQAPATLENVRVTPIDVLAGRIAAATADDDVVVLREVARVARELALDLILDDGARHVPGRIEERR